MSYKRNFYVEQLTLNNFGSENICRTIAFTKYVNFMAEKYVFQAFDCLLNPQFSNEAVLKPQYDGMDSFAEVTFFIGRKKFELTRLFGRGGTFTVNGKIATEETVKKIFEGFALNVTEPNYSTPTNFINDLMDQHIACQHQLLESLEIFKVEADKYIQLYDNTNERFTFSNVLKGEINAHAKIQRLEWKWLNSTNNRSMHATYYEEMKPILSKDPMDPQEFSIAVVNDCIKSLKYNISSAQEKICKRIVETSGKRNLNFVASHPDPANSLDEKIRSSTLCDDIKMKIARSQKLQGYAETQFNVYSADTNMVSRYKQDFVTAGAWEHEKAKLQQQYLDELTFYTDLTNKIDNKEDGLVILRQNIDETTNKLGLLRIDWEKEIKLVIELTVKLFSDLQSYILDLMLPFMDNFCADLCEALNHPSLSEVKDYVSGMAHNIENQHQSEYLFEHITSHKPDLLNILHTYLEPLSTTTFCRTTQDAADLQELISNELNARNVETRLIFAAHDTIERKEPSAEVKTLSTLRKSIGYGESFKNLLSHFLMTTDPKVKQTHSNLCNLGTKVIHFCNDNKMLLHGKADLFSLLRIIKKLCSDIDTKLCEFSLNIDDMMIIMEGPLQQHIDEFNRIEMEIHSELYKLKTLSFEALNITNTITNMRRLLANSKNRLKIQDQLLSLPDDDADSDSRFIETLSQQNTNVSELSFVEDPIAVLDNVYPQYTTDVQPVYDCIRKMHEQNLQLNTEMMPCLRKWEAKSAEFKLGHDGPQQSKLLKIVKLNYTRYGHALSEYESRNRIPKSFQRPNNITEQEIHRSIDAIVMNLRFPMVRKKLLTDSNNELKMLNDCHAIVNDVASKTATAIVSFDPWSKIVIDQLRISVNDELKRIHESQNNFIEVDMHEVDIDQIDWKKHALKQKQQVQSVRFNATDDRLVAILTYVFYIIKYTSQPLLLSNILQEYDEASFEKLCEIFESIKPTRFTVICGNNPLTQPTGSYPDPSPGYDADPSPGHDADPSPGRGIDLSHLGTGSPQRNPRAESTPRPQSSHDMWNFHEQRLAEYFEQPDSFEYDSDDL